jgi:hypothetical protein
MQRFVRLAALYEEETYHSTKIGVMESKIPDPLGIHGQNLVFVDEAARQRELSANANRIEGWRQTISYRYFQRVSSNLFITMVWQCISNGGDCRRILSHMETRVS